MTALPILFRPDAARDYLGGADPAKLTPPLRIGGRVFYAREALDRAVREKAGLASPREEEGMSSAYDDWKKERRAHDAA